MPRVEGPFVCYALAHRSLRRTYTGQTNNFARRLRQHNGELRGGARYTTRTAGRVPAGQRAWFPLFQVAGFRTLRSVLQFELAMKKRKVPLRFRPGIAFQAPVDGAYRRGERAYTRGPGGRIRQLEYLLSLGKLNDEPHSPFARNGITVRVFVSRERYLALGGMTDVQFEWARRAQPGVQFHFGCSLE